MTKNTIKHNKITPYAFGKKYAAQIGADISTQEIIPGIFSNNFVTLPLGDDFEI